MLNNKSVLITGGTGSFGKKLNYSSRLSSSEKNSDLFS